MKVGLCYLVMYGICSKHFGYIPQSAYFCVTVLCNVDMEFCNIVNEAGLDF